MSALCTHENKVRSNHDSTELPRLVDPQSFVVVIATFSSIFCVEMKRLQVSSWKKGQLWLEQEMYRGNWIWGVQEYKSVYLKIEAAMRYLGYSRTWKQCKTKAKNLTQRYPKVSSS